MAVVLSGLAGRAHWWLNVERSVTLTAAVVFFAAAGAIALLALRPGTSASLVQPLALANIAGGLAVWLFAILDWGRFEPEGRWLIAATADGFLALGVLELVALTRGRE